MGCYIFSTRSGLLSVLFKRINLLAVHAPQPMCKTLAETHMARPIRNVGKSPGAIILYTFEENKGNVLKPGNRATKYTGNQHENCRKRWILETPASFLNALHSLFVDGSFLPVLAEFFQNHLLLYNETSQRRGKVVLQSRA